MLKSIEEIRGDAPMLHIRAKLPPDLFVDCIVNSALINLTPPLDDGGIIYPIIASYDPSAHDRKAPT